MRTIRTDLTAAQARLLKRHRRGLVRLAGTLSARLDCEPTDLILLLADTASRVGAAAGERLGLPAVTDVMVIPGLARDLPRWIARLALAGPVHDCTMSDIGVVVIVIDEHGETVLCRVECGGATGKSAAQNCTVKSAD